MTKFPAFGHDSQDCGRFFLDICGRFAPGQIHVRWSDQPRPSNPEVDGIIEQTWRDQKAKAALSERRLYDGRLCRLIECAAGNGTIEMTLGPVSFREFLGTNLTHAHIRYTAGPEVLGDALGVSAAVTTQDGYIVMGLRSDRVAYHAGRIHPIGGVVEPSDPPGAAPDPFETITNELSEELGLSRQSLGKTLCLGLVRDKHIVQPELIFDIQAAMDVKDILAHRAGAVDACEHKDIIPVRNHPAAVVTFMENRSTELTPLGLATLLLHGLQAWGTGWFAAARGYLRTMF